MHCAFELAELSCGGFQQKLAGPRRLGNRFRLSISFRVDELCLCFVLRLFPGWQFLLNRQIPSLVSKSVYCGIFVVSCSLLLNLIAESSPSFGAFFGTHVYSETHFFDFPFPHRTTRYNLGGVPLYYLYCDFKTLNLQRLLSDVGIGLTFSITALVSFLLLTEIQLIPLFLSLKEKLRSSKAALSSDSSPWRQNLQKRLKIP